MSIGPFGFPAVWTGIPRSNVIGMQHSRHLLALFQLRYMGGQLCLHNPLRFLKWQFSKKATALPGLFICASF